MNNFYYKEFHIHSWNSLLSKNASKFCWLIGSKLLLARSNVLQRSTSCGASSFHFQNCGHTKFQVRWNEPYTIYIGNSLSSFKGEKNYLSILGRVIYLFLWPIWLQLFPDYWFLQSSLVVVNPWLALLQSLYLVWCILWFLLDLTCPNIEDWKIALRVKRSTRKIIGNILLRLISLA